MRAIHWFRNDLRLRDNLALARAARAADDLLPLFVIDRALIGRDAMGAARVRFLHDCLERLAADLEERSSALVMREGDPIEILPGLAREHGAELVTWNRDYSPYAKARDASVERALAAAGVRVETEKDRVLRESSEVLSQQNRPFAVYSPYRKVWWRRFEEDPPDDPSPLRLPPLPREVDAGALPSLEDLGAADDDTEIPTGGEAAALRRLQSFLDRDVERYAELRDLPSAEGTSRLSPYLRFGVISVRRCFQEARALVKERPATKKGAGKWMDELVWREFNHAILDEHPEVLTTSYRPEFREMRWDDSPERLEAWRTGHTGYPFVDAGMREMAGTGTMHNRVRMVVASFFTKDLLLDWRLGEREFMRRLVDGDPANNSMGWQWAASTGTDAQPFFRIFNPVTQGERFDPDGDYIRRWVPELAHLKGKSLHRPWEAPLEAPDYPAPIVDHSERRAIALARFREARGDA